LEAAANRPLLFQVSRPISPPKPGYRLAKSHPAVAPPTPALGTLSCAGLVVEETPLVKLTGVSATFAPDQFLVEACAPVSAGVEYVKKSFRQLLTVAGYGELAADLDLTAAYVGRFGAPQAGEKVFVRLRPVKNGFKGEPVQCMAIVAARPA
jgi:hypothetical protein